MLIYEALYNIWDPNYYFMVVTAAVWMALFICVVRKKSSLWPLYLLNI